MASEVTSTSKPKLQVQREITHRDYGREEYIDDCVQRVCCGQRVLVTLGGSFDPKNLPEVLRSKYSDGWFPGFEGAKEEVTSRLDKLSKKYLVEEFRGGSNSDLLGIPYDSSMSLDGYVITLASGNTAAGETEDRSSDKKVKEKASKPAVTESSAYDSIASMFDDARSLIANGDPEELRKFLEASTSLEGLADFLDKNKTAGSS
jgi:hypothetical protein